MLVNMPDNIYPLINEILKGRQLSISGVTRELKDKGVDEHRLVMTGYLRALKDLQKLNEVEIPPSKVYSIVETGQEDSGDIYSLVSLHIKSVDPALMVPVAAYVLSKTLDRPVFKEEFSRMGLSAKSLSDYLASGECALSQTDKNPKEYAAGVTKIKIPASEPAYELNNVSLDVIKNSNCILLKIVRSSVDLGGLIPKTKSTSLRGFWLRFFCCFPFFRRICMSGQDEIISMKPIGYVANDILEPSMARELKDGESRIVLKEEYTEALFRIDDFKQIQVLFFFSLSKGFNLIQKRRYDNKEAGVFASRSPNRPNGIGVSVVDLLKVEGNILHVKGLDAVNGTPILDIKPQVD
ncbi:MAG: tRNA (N6-threonylcarbamoyladenosine(37)-N6)-methyltransferase TrmO [Methanolobus sp.]